MSHSPSQLDKFNLKIFKTNICNLPSMFFGCWCWTRDVWRRLACDPPFPRLKFICQHIYHQRNSKSSDLVVDGCIERINSQNNHLFLTIFWPFWTHFWPWFSSPQIQKALIKQGVETKFQSYWPKFDFQNQRGYTYDQKMRIKFSSAYRLHPHETHFEAHAWPTLVHRVVEIQR